MSLITRWERKYGKYAIRNLMLYIIILYGVGFILNLVNPDFFPDYLSFSVPAILHGQVWRLVTFLIQPPSYDILYFLIAMYLYYMLGTQLERTWGSFRFNLYFILGVIGHILAGFLLCFLFRYDISLTTGYLNLSLFFAFAATYPDLQFLLMFVIPIKAKWLAVIEGLVYGYMIVTSLIAHDWATPILILLSLLNFIVFFLMTRNVRKTASQTARRTARRVVYQARVKEGQAASPQGGKTRHRCAVCGRTEADGEDLEFRFCSKCEGSYEYCQDHLYTHQHVKNGQA